MAVEQPSLFWEHLSDEHRKELERYGVDHVKRHQAMQYFTWRWGWSWFFRDPQARFLFRNTSPRTWLRSATERADLSDAAWNQVPWPKRERWLYSFLVRLLDVYARQNDPLGAARLDEPQLGDPLPVRRRGRLISQDLANSALEAAAISRALGGKAPETILEIGAGYGRLAFVLLSVFPGATYTIVDIEPALSISRWYLSTLFGAERLRFLSPDQADALEPGSIDLGLAISSLHEMTPEQVAVYLALLDRVAAGGTVYLKQWEQWTNPADGVTMRFDNYPVPARWELRFREPAPVQTAFQHAGWHVP